MDTKWNNTEEKREYRPKDGRVRALAGFLAFFLGVILVLSSLGAVGNRIAWERDVAPLRVTDWQNTGAFRDQVSRYLREFLTIGAGGTVDFYDNAYWTDYYGDAVVVQEEATRAWWGFYPMTEAVVVDRGLAEPDSSESEPARNEPEEDREPDESYRNDKNVLYYIRTGEVKDGKIYSNMGSGLDKLLARSVEGYNFYLQFVDGKVSIFKDGKALDVYGNGLYNDESQWFVPGYDNFPVSKDLEGVKVVMAVRRSPERYYGVDYKNGGTYYNSAFYNIAQQVEISRSFYRTQAALFGCGLLWMAAWLFLRKSTEPVNRKIASWTARVWTEVRFLLAAICAVWAFLPGLLNLDIVYDLLYSYDGCGWEGGYSFAAWGMAVLRFVTMNLPGAMAFFWLCWLIHNDHKHNPQEGRRSLLGGLFRSLRARDLKRPVEKRISRVHTAGLLALGLLLLAEAVNWFLFFYHMLFEHVLDFGSVFIQINGFMLFVQLPLGLLAIPLLALFLRAWRSRGLARDVAALADQVEAVRAGDLERPLKLPEDADLRQTAESLNDIQAGMRAALEEQTRSERMKVELVSNVSHDLKTPLTSILSYAELLRQEEDLPPAAADYAKIIDEKAQRLKTMVEDVFDISKAAADQLPVHLERLDLAKLLRQTLADMDGPIRESALGFKIELPQEPVLITADGKRLYRVFQNLIDNALRYALEGSRVYLTLKTAEGTEEAPGQAEVSVRNTSRTELPEGVDFTARFVRGDASRTDGGSGLGLSIAKSFTEACGGEFRVETVADLFTAIVTFPLEGE
ncbi:HAMP domain-containing sensor histidine kinase [Oscillibacter sp.]|uniref:HAMP domain-containing sensor histidine kinase n=1 Tax=Oscillibacter sp. TaxID=1945593 RepID=UPI002D801962|nr:HAMP domain-containing sensor histidine kinase [Oscillibacter sp.]